MSARTDNNQCSDTLLSANEIFYGPWTWVGSEQDVITVCKSDVDGTKYMDFYYNPSDPNATPATEFTPDSSIPYATEAGVTEPPHHLSIARGWYRTRYVNGSSAQSSFQIVTRHGVSGPVISPLSITMAQNADASVVRTVAEVQEISEGKRRGISFVRKFGKHDDVDAANTDITYGDANVAYTGFPMGSPENFEVLSSSVEDDDTTGTGAWTVRLYYLDDNWNAQTVDVTLNGTSGVDSGVSGRRCSRMIVLTSASSNTATNAGIITVRWISTTATVFLNIPVGFNQSQAAVYTIPSGYKGYLQSWDITMSKTASADGTVAIWVHPFGAAPLIKVPKTITQASPVDEKYPDGWLELEAKTDIALRVLTISTTNIAFTAEMTIRLIKQ